MKNFIRLILASTLLGIPAAQATIIGARTTGGLFSADTDGGIGSNYAYVSGNQITNPEPFLGSANYSYQAEATFNVGALTPVLRAEAYSDDLTPLSDPFINADAFGLQTYQNISATTQTFTLNLNLDGDILRAPGSSYIDAEVNIYSGTDIVADASACGGDRSRIQGFNSWICGAELGTGFLTSIEFATDGTHSLVDSVSFDILAGDTFTIYAELRALTFGGYADAFSTLAMTFEDTSNLAALGPMAAVPEPAAMWVLISGLAGLAITRRRQAH